LAPGMHIITMKVTNSAGVSSSKDFVIEIIEDESDIPDDWPRNDITVALRMGYYQPLDRLASPITRLELAKMMYTFYSLTLNFANDGMGIPDGWSAPYPDNIILEMTDISDGYDHDVYEVVKHMILSGLMELKNATYETKDGKTVLTGAFDPHGTLTEREAMQVMCMCIKLSLTQTYMTYEVLDESEFLPQLYQFGMLDEPGSFNAYNPDERMSKGMTMIRCARFVKYAFGIIDEDYGASWGYNAH